jgi:phosphate transport system protein
MNAIRHQHLEALTDPLEGMIRLAQAALSHATASLLAGGPVDAENMAASGRTLRALDQEVEDHAALILREPTGLAVSDLRTVVAAVHVNADAASLGDLARQLAALVPAGRLGSRFPPEARAILRAMGQVCLDAVGEAATAIAVSPDAGNTAVTSGEFQIKELRHRLYRRLLSGTHPVDLTVVVDATLAGRCYERCVDRAASVSWHGMLLVEPARIP